MDFQEYDDYTSGVADFWHDMENMTEDDFTAKWGVDALLCIGVAELQLQKEPFWDKFDECNRMRVLSRHAYDLYTGNTKRMKVPKSYAVGHRENLFRKLYPQRESA